MLLAMSWWLVATALTSLLCGLVWWHYRHFQRRGVPYVPAVPLFGVLYPVVMRKKAFFDLLADLYGETKDHAYVGVFNFQKPIVMVRDPELIRTLGVKDFDHFTDHESIISEKADPIFGKNLVSLKGQRWRSMRATLSPAFTSSKMKNMFVLMSDIGKQMVEYLQKATKNEAKDGGGGGDGEPLVLDMKDFFTRVTNDIIASTAFGYKVDSLTDRDNEFFAMGTDISKFSATRGFVLLGYMLMPKVMEFFNITVFTKSKKFFRKLVKDTIRTRDEQGIVRPDMIHLMMQARKGQLLHDEGSNENNDDANAKIALEEDDIVAQSLLFFAGGFDTVATLMCFVSYMLATNPEVQTRLQEEVDAVMVQSDGQPSYDQVQGLKYLDMVVSETLRMYTPGGLTDRMCVKDYRLPPSDTCPNGVHLRKGDRLWFPSHGLHHDPQYHPDPERFDPERFSDENRAAIKPYTYLPFGVGPRICIAQRFALLEAKAVLCFLVWKFNLKVCSKTTVPLKLCKKTFTLIPEGGFWLGVEPRS